MTKKGQTHGMKATDLVSEMQKYAKRKPDIVLVNNKEIPKSVIKQYEAKDEYEIEDDIKEEDYEVIRASLISNIQEKQDKGDTLVRSLIRHDSVKLGKILYHKIIKKRRWLI